MIYSKRLNIPTTTHAFSLLEVMLALVILGTMAGLSTQAISRGLKASSKIQNEIDDVSALRDTMRIIRSDINMAYHHRDFEDELNKLINKKPTQSGQTPQSAGQQTSGSTENPTQRQTKRYDPATHFVGDNDKVSLVTMNNGRMTANLAQADFIEVGYSVKECKNLTSGQASKCLFRRVQSVIDEDVTQGGNETVILENIAEFKLRYFGEGKQDWANAWNSTSKSSEEVTKDKFPDSVEVSATVEREVEKKKRTYSMQFVIPIHFPNNPDKKNDSSSNATQGQPQGTQNQNGQQGGSNQ